VPERCQVRAAGASLRAHCEGMPRSLRQVLQRLPDDDSDVPADL
jgi:hypothetical protein